MEHITKIKEKMGERSFLGRAKESLHDAPSTSWEADKGLLVIRVGLGAFFIYHGLGKFFGFSPEGGIDVVAAMFTGIGFPASIFWAYFVAFVELFGGIAVTLGFLTRLSSVFLAVIALVAFVTVKDFTLGIQAGDVDILAFAMALGLLLAGPGKIALAERWYREDMMQSAQAPEEEAEEKPKTFTPSDEDKISTSEKTDADKSSVDKSEDQSEAKK